MIAVTILVQTRNRAHGLADALASIGRQQVPADVTLDVLVIDRSRDASGAAVVRDAALPLPVLYRHVPGLGVAAARNGGVLEARGDLLAFLDDDCTADDTWLAAQVTTLLHNGAAASFGPRLAMPAGPKPRGADRARADLSRDLALPDGAHVGGKTEALALSGAAFVKARCFSMAQPFDPRLDAVGCSDALFFRRLAERGHRLVWSMGARVTAHVPAESTEPAGLMWQRYLSGQCRCLVPMLLDPPRRAEAAFQTMKSGAAVALSAPVALAGRALGGWPPRATGLLMSGLGTIAGWRLAAVLSGRGGR